MKIVSRAIIFVQAILMALPVMAQHTPQPELRPDTLVGLWASKKYLGPEVSGALRIVTDGDSWTAEIAGRYATANVVDSSISFDLADSSGSFKGWVRGDRISGHWIQPRSIAFGSRYATPVTLTTHGTNQWVGDVEPLQDRMTWYLPVGKDTSGVLQAFLRNPERNAGIFLGIEQVTAEGTTLHFKGRRSSEDSLKAVLSGTYDTENDQISIGLPWRGGTFDFTRASLSDEAGFLPRGKSGNCYKYLQPPALGDGWQVGSLEDADLSVDSISAFVQMLIEMPMSSIHASDIHGLLIARHGKLVLEEYFHAFHREMLHDTRSAAKSVGSVLVGAAMLRGYPISEHTHVYETMGDAATSVEQQSRKRNLTLEHLLTMTSGLDCDDSDPESPGNEDNMQDQEAQPDWYRYTLDLAMVRNPGDSAVYCSCNAHLAGGVLGRATGHWVPDLFRELLAEPLQIHRYAMNLAPTGDAYMGGGIQFQPRDFMKIGQVMLDSGRWNGRQIVSPEWVTTSLAPRHPMAGIQYGYLWWILDYPFHGDTVRAFFAGGNGGQLLMGIPSLDLLIMFWGGNYSDRVSLLPQRVFVPEHILTAVKK